MSVASTVPASPTVWRAECSVCGRRGMTSPHACPGLAKRPRVHRGADNEADRRAGLVLLAGASKWYAERTVTIMTAADRVVVPAGHSVDVALGAAAWRSELCALPCDYVWSEPMIAAAHEGRPMWAVAVGQRKYAGLCTYVAQTATLRCTCGFECRTEAELSRHTGVRGVLRQLIFDDDGRLAMDAARFVAGEPELAAPCCSMSRTLGCRCGSMRCTHWVATTDSCAGLLAAAGVPDSAAELFRGRGIDAAYALMREIMTKNRRALQLILGVPVAGRVLKFLEPIAAAPVFARWPGGDLRYVAAQPRPEADATIAEVQLVLGLLRHATNAECCCGRCASRRCFGPLRPLATILGVGL